MRVRVRTVAVLAAALVMCAAGCGKSSQGHLEPQPPDDSGTPTATPGPGATPGPTSAHPRATARQVTLTGTWVPCGVRLVTSQPTTVRMEVGRTLYAPAVAEGSGWTTEFAEAVVRNTGSTRVKGITGPDPYVAVTDPQGVVVATISGMRASALGWDLAPGEERPWSFGIPLVRCAPRAPMSPRQFLPAGDYDVWLTTGTGPGDVWAGGPFPLRVGDREHPGTRVNWCGTTTVADVSPPGDDDGLSLAVPDLPVQDSGATPILTTTATMTKQGTQVFDMSAQTTAPLAVVLDASGAVVALTTMPTPGGPHVRLQPGESTDLPVEIPLTRCGSPASARPTPLPPGRYSVWLELGFADTHLGIGTRVRAGPLDLTVR